MRKPNSPTDDSHVVLASSLPWTPFLPCKRCRLRNRLSPAPAGVPTSLTPAPHFLLEPPLPCLPSVLPPWPPPWPWPAFSLLALAAIAARLEKSSCGRRVDRVRVAVRSLRPKDPCSYLLASGFLDPLCSSLVHLATAHDDGGTTHNRKASHVAWAAKRGRSVGFGRAAYLSREDASTPLGTR